MFLSFKYAALALPIRAFISASDPPCSSMMLPKYDSKFQLSLDLSAKCNYPILVNEFGDIFLNHNEFRQYGTKMIQYVADYLETIDKRKVFPKIHPGYLAKLIPNEAPNESESWEDIMKDVEKFIMPGVSNWNT
ncbi:unnamed protein product [Schistosoma mattheei]|uniref:Uncharacterized protein n=1 Tax=Schistosoma mattheei TaxID=31246 RepID=A0A183PKE3_9TREM|nr:unnamed protein product [Schistosoma mattheei]